MIECFIRLECDTCGRIQTVTLSKLYGPVDVPVIVSSCRWNQFLNGPTLCPECVQNHGPDQEAVARAARIHLAASAKKEVQEVMPKTNGHPIRPILPVIPDRPVRPVPPRYKLRGMTDQEVLDIVNSSKSKAEAARKIGVSYTGIIARMRAIRDKVVPALSVLMVLMLLASCSTRGLDSPQVAPKKPQEREVVFPPMPPGLEESSEVSKPGGVRPDKGKPDPDPDPALVIVEPRTIRLEFDDVPDGLFAIERSTDLILWDRFGSVHVPAVQSTNEAGVIMLTYDVNLEWTAGTGQSRLFYRLIPIPSAD